MDRINEVAAAFEKPDLVTISLEDGGIFYLQEPILCKISEYFTAALQGAFAESQTKTLVLPGYDTPTFKLFLCWLRDPAIVFGQKQSPMSDQDREERQILMAQVWMLGDMLSLPRLQNDAIYELHWLVKGRTFSPRVVQLVLDGTSERCPLREFVMRHVIYSWYRGSFDGGHYTAEEKAALGAVAGLLDAFAHEVQDHVRNDYPGYYNKHEFRLPPDVTHAMVKGDESRAVD